MTKSITDLARKAGFAMENSAAMQAADKFAALLKAAHLEELLAGVEMPEPVVWQSRFFESHPQTVNYGTWSEWELVTPRNIHTDTVADRVREFQSYITQGYKYELRALVTLDQCQRAVAAAVAKAVAAEREQCAVLVESRAGMHGSGSWNPLIKAANAIRARGNV